MPALPTTALRLALAATAALAAAPAAAGRVVRARVDAISDDGFSTAELLANAAFAIVALFAIWQALQAMGIDVVDQIGARLTSP